MCSGNDKKSGSFIANCLRSYRKSYEIWPYSGTFRSSQVMAVAAAATSTGLPPSIKSPAPKQLVVTIIPPPPSKALAQVYVPLTHEIRSHRAMH